MSSILNRASRNFLWRHPWQLALSLLGVTLGVAVVIAIDLALESSLQSFEQAGKAISGTASYRIIAGDGGLDERIYNLLRVQQGIRNLSPVLQTRVTLPQHLQTSFKLVGIDPYIEKSFQSSWQKTLGPANSQTVARLVSEPNTALLSIKTASQLNLKINDSLTISTNLGERQLRIIGVINPSNAIAEQALHNTIISDIATTQELTGLYGKLSFIDVMPSGLSQKKLAVIGKTLPGNAQIVALETQAQSIRRMTEAFSINLTALSLLSLLIGMFLIYNTMTFLVVQRRKLIGILRLLGVTRRQIFFLILKEAFFLGIIGTSAGILLGMLIGQELLQRVSATMDTIYFSVDAKTLFVSPWQIGKAAALGLSATFLAVLPPAWEATRLSPIAAMSRSQLETGVRHLIKSANLFGIILIMTGIGVAFFSSTSITLGLSSIFLLLIGFALLTPSLTSVIMTGIERLSARILGILGKLPPRMVNAEISRTSIAIAALMIVVAATIGMELMIDSFRLTVSQWLKITLQADFYVAVSNDKQALDKAQADRQLKSRITELPGVTMVSSVLHTRVMGDRESIPVSVFELNERSKRGFILDKDKFPDIWRLFEQQQSIIVTEAYAYHRQVSPGATLRLKTDQGLQDFTVLAVYKDYSGDQGHIAMSRRQYLRFWPDLGYSGIGVYAQQDTDVNRLEQRLRAMLKNTQMLRSNADIYTASMQIFEQTFKVTETLRWLAAGIAFVGIFGALMALQFERTRQLGILRAIGITPEQITLLITAETGLMGLVAGLLAIPAGLIVAYMLIFVVYPRSFGWTMAFHMNPVALMQGLLLAFGAALVAGIIPGRKMAQSSPARALRSE